MHGKYKRLPGNREGVGCPGAGDLPNRGSLGKAESEFRRYLLTVSRKKGMVLYCEHEFVRVYKHVLTENFYKLNNIQISNIIRAVRTCITSEGYRKKILFSS